MRKVSTILLFLVSFFIFSIKTVFATSDYKLWIIADSHFLSPSLVCQGPKLDELENTAIGLDLHYGSQRMEALVHQIQAEKPQALVIAGDLTLNGEYQSLLDLSHYYQRIEELGCQVYVIPGNHDISNDSACKIEADQFYKTEKINPETFKELMLPFGYLEASSLDPNSLSYAVDISPKLQLIMIDSNDYDPDCLIDSKSNPGSLSKETLDWLEERLSYAKENNMASLPVLHHCSLSHFKLFSETYLMTNHQEFASFMEKYEINLVLSAHMHVQSISQGPYYEIATAAFSLNPSTIGELLINTKTFDFEYQVEPLDTMSWAACQNIEDPQLIDHSCYLKDLFVNQAKDRNSKRLDTCYLQEQEIQQYLDLIAEFNLAFYNGQSEDYYQKHQDDIDSMIVELNQINQPGSSFLAQYLQAIIDSNQSINQTQLKARLIK